MILNGVIFLVIMAFSIVCIFCGYQFSKGRWLMLIAGYNDLPEEIREKQDKVLLSKESSKTTYAAGIYLLIQGVLLELLLFDVVQGILASLLLVGVPILSFIFYMISRARQYKEQIKK